MRAPEDAGLVPELGAAVRLTRSFVGAIVVIVFAGTGYTAGRIWPLPTFSGPMMHLAATDNTSSTGSEFTEGAPALTSQVSKSAATTDPSASLDVLSQSALAVAAHSPETAQIEAGGSTVSPSSSEAVLSQRPQAHGDARSMPTTSTDTSKDRSTAAAQRRAAGAKASRIVRRQRTSGAEPKVVEFAPNPRPNQALRDFMAARSTSN